MERQVVNPWRWQDAFGFVQANRVTGATRMVFCSGQLAVEGEGHPLHAGDMNAQIEQALDNLETVLRESGLQLSDVVRLNYYTTDVEGFIAAGATLGRRLAEAGCRPASTLLGIARLAFPESLVEIEATAVGYRPADASRFRRIETVATSVAVFRRSETSYRAAPNSVA